MGFTLNGNISESLRLANRAGKEEVSTVHIQSPKLFQINSTSFLSFGILAADERDLSVVTSVMRD